MNVTKFRRCDEASDIMAAGALSEVSNSRRALATLRKTALPSRCSVCPTASMSSDAPRSGSRLHATAAVHSSLPFQQVQLLVGVVEVDVVSELDDSYLHICYLEPHAHLRPACGARNSPQVRHLRINGIGW